MRADPIRLNARFGTYTNFVNFLGCSPSRFRGFKSDGLPFGVTLVAPLSMMTPWRAQPRRCMRRQIAARDARVEIMAAIDVSMPEAPVSNAERSRIFVISSRTLRLNFMEKVQIHVVRPMRADGRGCQSANP